MLKIKFDTNNNAFVENRETEITKILSGIAYKNNAGLHRRQSFCR